MAGRPPNGPAGMHVEGDPAQTAVDFWDLGAEQAGGAPMTQDYEFSEIVNVQPVQKASNPVMLLLAVLLLGAVGGAGWFLYTSDEDPIAMILGWIEGADTDLPVAQAPAKNKSARPGVISDSIQTSSDRDKAERVIVGNPYWYLPNAIDSNVAALSRTWTPEEEEVWRLGMAHPFTYQRYKTVKDVRAARLSGSEAILWDALNQPKFWTRMWALVGLAEFNIPVSVQVVEETIGTERNELVADFFERFIEGSSSGQRYVMRQAIRLLDEKARLNILKSLDKANDSLRNMYLVAATMDPGTTVQDFVRRALSRRPIAEDEFERLASAITSGEIEPLSNAEKPLPGGLRVPVDMTGSLDKNVVFDQTLKAGMDGEAGAYEEVAEYDDYGVEFYEADDTSTGGYEGDDYEVDENF